MKKEVVFLQNDLFYYMNQLATKLQKQEEKLANLEKANQELNKTIDSLKEQPPINVERIDYHFDQLKIERLEGTLNIGLNPGDLKGMDEFSIPTTDNSIPSMEQNKPSMDQLHNKLNNYIDQDLPRLVQEKKDEFNIQLDDSYTQFVKEDLRKQLPSRIQFYAQKLTQEKRNWSQEELEKEIYQRMVHDITQAVHAFIQQFPMRGGGEENNDLGSNEL